MLSTVLFQALCSVSELTVKDAGIAQKMVNLIRFQAWN